MSYLFLPPLDPDPDPNKKLGVWIRIHMDIFGILDPDPHKNLCRSETLLFYLQFFFHEIHIKELLTVKVFYLQICYESGSARKEKSGSN